MEGQKSTVKPNKATEVQKLKKLVAELSLQVQENSKQVKNLEKLIEKIIKRRLL